MAGATIVLDFHRDSYPAKNEPSRSELAVTTAVALANAVCLMGQPVGLITNGRDAADRIRLRDEIVKNQSRPPAQSPGRPSTGRDARARRPAPSSDCAGEPRPGRVSRRIREVLARVELTDGLTFDQLLIEAEPQASARRDGRGGAGERHAHHGRWRSGISSARDSP